MRRSPHAEQPYKQTLSLAIDAWVLDLQFVFIVKGDATEEDLAYIETSSQPLDPDFHSLSAGIARVEDLLMAQWVRQFVLRERLKYRLATLKGPVFSFPDSYTMAASQQSRVLRKRVCGQRTRVGCSAYIPCMHITEPSSNDIYKCGQGVVVRPVQAVGPVVNGGCRRLGKGHEVVSDVGVKIRKPHLTKPAH